MPTAISKFEGRAPAHRLQVEPWAPSLPALGADVLRNLLGRSERDLVAARDRVRRKALDVSHLAKQLAHLERHAALLEAEVQKLRSHAAPRDEELRDLRERLSVADLARDEALATVATGRAERSALRREIAQLRPRAQSNTAALRALAAAQAACEAMRRDRGVAGDVVGVAIRKLTAAWEGLCRHLPAATGGSSRSAPVGRFGAAKAKR